MALYEFWCKNGHLTEAIRPTRVDFVPCHCGRSAIRSEVNRVAIVAPTVDTRSMFRRYTEATQEMDHSATRVEQNTGHAVQTPSFWKQAKAKAAAMVASGEAPPVRPLN